MKSLFNRAILQLLAFSVAFHFARGDANHLQKEQALLKWLETHPGFQSKVTIGYNAKGVRGTFANTDIAAVSTCNQQTAIARAFYHAVKHQL